MDPKAVIMGIAVIYLSAMYLTRRRSRRTTAKAQAQVPSVPLRVVDGATVHLSPFVYVPAEDALVSAVSSVPESFVAIRDAYGPNGPTATAVERWGASVVVTLSPPRGLFTSAAQTTEASMVMGTYDGRLYEVVVIEPSLSEASRLDAALQIAVQVEAVSIPRPPWGTVVVSHAGQCTQLPSGAVGFLVEGSTLFAEMANSTIEVMQISGFADATVTFRDNGVSLPLVQRARVCRSSLAPCYSLRIAMEDVDGTIEHWKELPGTWRRHPATTEMLKDNVLSHMTNKRATLLICDVGGQESVLWDETTDGCTCRTYVCPVLAKDSVWVVRWVSPASQWEINCRVVVGVMDGLSLPLR